MLTDSNIGLNINNAATSAPIKHSLFLKALEHIDPYLKRGYGFTISDINEYMISLDENVYTYLYNRDGKRFLIEHYGNDIQLWQRCQ